MSKILTLETAIQLRNDLDAQGKKLVFTNGVFDLLHVGHLDYLEKARNLGDALLVAINNDESTRKYKGAARPLVADVERARLLLALEPVSAVMLFSEATVDNLLLAIRPHIYAKGGDYTPETLPEYPTLQAYGGELHLIEYLPNHSTSDLIKKIRLFPKVWLEYSSFYILTPKRELIKLIDRYIYPLSWLKPLLFEVLDNHYSVGSPESGKYAKLALLLDIIIRMRTPALKERNPDFEDFVHEMFGNPPEYHIKTIDKWWTIEHVKNWNEASYYVRLAKSQDFQQIKKTGDSELDNWIDRQIDWKTSDEQNE